MTTSTTSTAPSRPLAGISARALPAFAAFAIGFLLFVATGFAWPNAIHNATHDTRHSPGLPCH
jgi:cobalt transporter subunit CbtB